MHLGLSPTGHPLLCQSTHGQCYPHTVFCCGGEEERLSSHLRCSAQQQEALAFAGGFRHAVLHHAVASPKGLSWSLDLSSPAGDPRRPTPPRRVAVYQDLGRITWG